MQLMQDAHLTLCQCCSRKHSIAEMVFRNYLRTGEREEDATLLNFLKRLLVESRITLQCVMQGTTMFGKGGRVKNNEVITGCWLLAIGFWHSNTLQKLKGVLAIGLMAGITREVQLHILLGQLDGFG